MDRNIVLNGGGNIILAEGHSRGFWRPWRIAIAGILGGFLVLLVGFFWLLSRPLPLPEGTLFYAVVTPGDMRMLPSDVRDALPADWRSYLDRASRWPFVFGIYRQGETLFSFVISPRWHAPITEKIHQQTRGLALISADTALASDTERSYLSYASERWRSGSPILGVRPFEVLGYVNGGDSEWMMLSIRDGVLVSNIQAPSAPHAPLYDADVSFHLTPEGSAYLAEHFATLAYLPAPDRLSRLPALVRADIDFHASTQPVLTRLQFERALTDADAGILLGAYGFSIRRPIVLPDGTTSFERVEPTATSGTSLLGPRKDELGRMADISKDTFTLLHASTTTELHPVASCANASAWIRLSAKTVAAVANRFGLALEATQVRPIQIVSENGKFTACFE